MAKKKGGKLDLSGGRAARDEGIELVSERGRPWIEAAILVLYNLPIGWRGQMEDLRDDMERDIGKPHHRNIYGALANKAVRMGILVYPGGMQQMKRTTSHARITRVLERTSR